MTLLAQLTFRRMFRQWPKGNIVERVIYEYQMKLKFYNHIHSLRHPLQEIKHDLLETPMSVADVLSPMSVDKSSVLNQSTGSLLNYSRSNEADKFFEMVEYQLDIFEYLRETEVMFMGHGFSFFNSFLLRVSLQKKHLPKAHYMQKQPDINHSMRTILVDWLVEVCEEYRLQSETLCLAVSYIDRFLSTMSVVRAKLQLVGTAAMFIAS